MEFFNEAERIRDAIGYLSADCDRDEWVKVGMAIKSELGDQGFDIWDEWSQRGDSYDSRDARDTWRSIKSGGGITIATFYDMAKRAGWINGSNGAPGPEEAALRKKAAERTAPEGKPRSWKLGAGERQRRRQATWSATGPALADHPYLTRKQIAPVASLHESTAVDIAQRLGYAPKCRGEFLQGRILIAPILGADRSIASLELIDEHGRKAALAGGKKGGGYWPAQKLPDDGADLLVIGEGIATTLTAAQVAGCSGVATLTSGNLVATARVMRARFPARPMVILADLDKETGETDPHAIAAAKASRAGLAVPIFGSDRPADMTDFNDLRAMRGPDVVRRLIECAQAEPQGDDAEPAWMGELDEVDRAESGERGAAWVKGGPNPDHSADGGKAPSPDRYKLLTADEVMSAPRPRWLVQGILPETGVAALYGASTSGKSFIMLDLARAVSLGVPWFGRRVRQAPVVYVALEGEGGFRLRVEAMQIRYQTTAPIRFVIGQPFHLVTKRDVRDLSAAIVGQVGQGAMVIVDTLNCAAPEMDEISGKEVGPMLVACKELQRITGGLVVLVGHTGKDEARGWRIHSSAFAAIEAAIEVSRTLDAKGKPTPDSPRSWRAAKVKDGADGEVNSFELRIVELGDDEEGLPVTSCVVEPVDRDEQEDKPIKQSKARPSGANQNIAYNAIGPLLGRGVTGKEGAPSTRPCITVNAAIDAIAAQMPADEIKRKRARAQEAVDGLVGRKVLGCFGEWIWEF